MKTLPQSQAPDKPRSDPVREDGRTRILDAAEAKFAVTGYFGTGLREIAQAASVPLSLIYHHFGNKEELFHQVIARRAEEHGAAMNAALDQAIRDAEDGLPPVDAVIRAYVGPVLKRSVEGGPGWKNYVQLLGRAMHSRQYDEFMQPVISIYDPVTERFINSIRAIFSQADEERIHWCFFLLQSSFIHVVVESGLVDRQSGGLCRSSDLLRLLDEFVPFFAAAFTARLAA